MANEQNLKPRNLTNEEAVEMGRKGGIASGKARRERKTFKKQMELLLSLPLQDGKTKDKLIEMGIDPDNIDNQMALLISVFQKGLKTGDKSVAEFFRDSIDGKPVEKMEHSGSIPVVIDDDIKE